MTEVCESGTELAREIQLTYWSTARKQGKPFFVVSTRPSLAQFISIFTTGKKMSFDRPNCTSIQVFHFKISVKKKRRKKFVSTNNFLFRNFTPSRRLCVRRKPV